MPLLELTDVAKSFGGASILRGVNLAVAPGEFVAIVGYSGSGKTTLMSLMAGLTRPDSGSVRFEGREVEGPGPDRGVVFQNYSLLPWLSVSENVALGVDEVFPQLPAAERRARVDRCVERVHLGHARQRRPAQLSGGMRQRVALARALAIEPRLLLLDEPLSALDALTRASLQNEIAALREREQTTVVLITNDVDEALLLADRIVPLTPGPGATLGASIPVTVPRPRDREAVNHDAEFKRLKALVTGQLLGYGKAARVAVGPRPPLPQLAPADLDAPRTPWTSPPARRAGRREDIEITGLAKSFPGPKGTTAVLSDFNLEIGAGEFIALIGHSGCGKSTVLSIMAGLAEASAGGVIIGGREVTGAGPDRGVVFQAPCLLPWLTVRENVLLGVDQVYPTASRADRQAIADHYLALVGLGEALDRRPADLSQGMRQRCGIARAFALSPRLLLLDEPFGMLDSLTRAELQEALIDLWQQDRKTALMVTHDVDEALFLADRVVMMTSGPGARVGEILDVPFPRPRSRAALLADPDFYRLRERVIRFLGEAGSSGHAPAAPAPLPPRPASSMKPSRLIA